MQKKKSNISGGCLFVILMIMLGVVVYAILVSFGFKSSMVAFVALVVSSFFVRGMLKQIRTKGKYRILFPIVFALVIFMGFGYLFYVIGSLEGGANYNFTNEDVVVEDTLKIKEVSVPVFSSARSWRDNSGNDFKGTLSVRKEDHFRLEDLSKNYTASSNDVYFWGGLYDYLEQQSTPSLDLLFTTFEQIGRDNSLNQMEFADMVTSCIQDIPYSLVFESVCLSANQYADKTIKDVLDNCPDCCVGSKAFGIQAPVEFMATLKGDCDSRTVLIYSILKHFGYDVAILNSEEYRHSILGLNIPASGAYKPHRGKKYYLWETTSKFFRLGHMAPGMENISYWDIVLISK